MTKDEFIKNAIAAQLANLRETMGDRLVGLAREHPELQDDSVIRAIIDIAVDAYSMGFDNGNELTIDLHQGIIYQVLED